MDEDLLVLFLTLSPERQDLWLAELREIADRQSPEPFRPHLTLGISYSLPVFA